VKASEFSFIIVDYIQELVTAIDVAIDRRPSGRSRDGTVPHVAVAEGVTGPVDVRDAVAV